MNLRAETAWRYAAPALEGMAEAGCFAKAEVFGDAADRPFLLAKQGFCPLKTQLIEQFLVVRAQFLQVPTQGARRAVHLLRQLFQTGWRGEQIGRAHV